MSEAKAGGAVSTYTVIGNVDANGKAQSLATTPLSVETTAATRNALPGASGAITGAAGRLIGFSLRETAGATAVLRLRDGTDATGGILDTVSLAANESLREWFGPGGKAVATGVYYQLVSGTVEGAVFTRGV